MILDSLSGGIGGGFVCIAEILLRDVEINHNWFIDIGRYLVADNSVVFNK